MLSVIFAKFPQVTSEFCVLYIYCIFYQTTLHKLAAFFFVPLASRLVNDDAPTCRSMVAEALKVLIIHVSTNIYISGHSQFSACTKSTLFSNSTRKHTLKNVT